MNNNKSSWTPERLAKLKELWKSGLSISKIGLELGVSRNAVAGKAHRLGLSKRQPPINNPNKYIDFEKLNIGPKPLRLTLRDLEWSRNSCLWPSGDPKFEDFNFCGKKVVHGRPYCIEHCDIAYNNSKE